MTSNSTRTIRSNQCPSSFTRIGLGWSAAIALCLIGGCADSDAASGESAELDVRVSPGGGQGPSGREENRSASDTSSAEAGAGAQPDALAEDGGTSDACRGSSCPPGPTYEWQTKGWSSCSESCGGGTQTREVSCIDAETGDEVADSKCGDSKPETSRSCNSSPCETHEWQAGDWSECSADCGKGDQSRDVSCVEIESGMEVDDSECDGSTPPESRTCDAGPCNYEWETSSWTTCSSQCRQSRNVTCRNVTRGTGAAVSKCDSNKKPKSGRSCQGGNCPTTEQSCGDGNDNDRDGDVDCKDSDCTGRSCSSNGSGAICRNSTCVETACGNQVDDDGDRATDCQDSDCSSEPACSSGGGLPPSLRNTSALRFWLKSTDVRTSGGDVAEWLDQAGNGFVDFIPPSNDPSSAPSLVQSQIAGKPAVRFDGKGDRLNARNRASNYVDTQVATIFFVFKNRDGSHIGQLLSSCGGGVGNNQIRLDRSPDELYVHADGYYRDETFKNLSVPTTQWHVMSLVIDSSTIEVYQNGSKSGSKSVSSSKSGSFKFNEIGNRCSESEKLDADVAEMLFYNRVLSSSERAKVESYLKGRYGL